MNEAHPHLDVMGVAWRLGATLFFVALNGFFVAAEFALVKVRGARIDEMARKGRRSARTVQHVVRNLDRYLSACQLGITLASLILGALGEPAVSVLILAAAAGMGVELSAHEAWLPAFSIALAFLVITALHMTVGEQAPKMWALRRAEGTALSTAPTLRAFAWLFGPLIVGINATSNALLRLVGLPMDAAHDGGHTSEEIRSILSLSARAGHISDHERELAENVFRMIDLEVRHIVVPRVDVTFLTLEKDLEENLERIRASGHSRLPLCEAGLDTIVGIVHAKDVLEANLRGEMPDLRAVAREALYVPDTMALSDFLRELQATRQHCAVVLDEHGTAIGLAFREDALEEIVGPLGDEFDVEEPDVVELPGGGFEMPGRLPLPEVCDRLDLHIPSGEHEDEETIGGHVTARLGRLPREGDCVGVGPWKATVVEVSRRRVQRLRMDPPPEEEEEAQGSEDRDAESGEAER